MRERVEERGCLVLSFDKSFAAELLGVDSDWVRFLGGSGFFRFFFSMRDNFEPVVVDFPGMQLLKSVFRPPDFWLSLLDRLWSLVELDDIVRCADKLWLHRVDEWR